MLSASFNEHDILAITPISQGLSQECLLVEALQQKYVIKRFDNLHSFHTELVTLKALQTTGLSAKLIAANTSENVGLILMEYISGHTLRNDPQPISSKLSTAAALLARFHHAVPQESIETIAPLALEPILLDLLNNAQLNKQQQLLTFNLINNTLGELKALERKGYTQVVCHGDFNFTNIVVSDSLYVIDFESVSLMPVEYDIAMMLAVNEYSLDAVEIAIEAYLNSALQRSFDVDIEVAFIKKYYALSLLINGLWYQAKSHHMIGNKVYSQKANAQFELLKHI